MIEAWFIDRPNRFVMNCELATGEKVRAYCPSTSRLIGLLEDSPGLLLNKKQTVLLCICHSKVGCTGIKTGPVTQQDWLSSLRTAANAGVKIKAFRCQYVGETWEITDEIPTEL